MADADSDKAAAPRPRRLSLAAALAVVCLALGAGTFIAWPALEGLFVPSVFAKTGSFPLRDRPVHSLLVSADEKVLAYVAATPRGAEYLVLRRGDRIFTGKPYPAIRDLALSADGSRWAYIALRDPGNEAELDGAAGFAVTGRARGSAGSTECEAEGQPFDYIGNLRLSKNGRHLAYVAGRDGVWRRTAGKGLRYGGGTMSAIRDGKPGPSCDRVTFLSMSDDGKHLAWAERRDVSWKELEGGGWEALGGRACVRKDGESILACDGVDFLALNPVSGRLLFLAATGGAWAAIPGEASIRIGGKQVLYSDGRAMGNYDWCGGIAVAADLSTWAFAAGRGGGWTQTASGSWSYGAGRWVVVTDAGESESHDAILSFEATADGKAYTCEAGDGGEWRKKSDGSWAYGKGRWKILGRGSSIDIEYRPGGLDLSPDGRHVAFFYPVRILNYDEDDLAWWYSPSDRPLRVSVDGIVREEEYAAISDLIVDDNYVYIKGRRNAVDTEETQVLDLGGHGTEAPAGLASAIIVSKDGRRKLWVASVGASYDLVVE